MDRSSAVRLSATTVATLVLLAVVLGRSIGLFGMTSADPVPAGPVATASAAPTTTPTPTTVVTPPTVAVVEHRSEPRSAHGSDEADEGD